MDYNITVEKDYLDRLLHYYYPLHFFALFRAHELYSVEPFIDVLSAPILDLGCGDGMIARMLFGHRLEYGMDTSSMSVRRAFDNSAYKQVFCGEAHNIPLGDGSLGGVFSNCVLEHIPDMPALIQEISRVLRPGACFVATCLTPFYYALNPVFHWFDRPPLRVIRQKMIGAENKLHNHVSVFGVEEYRSMFESSGMILETHKYYAPELVANFSNTWDTLSKYIIPFPARLQHSGILVKYLRLLYGRLSEKEAVISAWNSRLRSICYDRNSNNQVGVGQILVARKL